MTNLPSNPTRSELLERHWLAFLKFQQAEVRKCQKSGFGVPKADFDEQAFWEWLTACKLEDE